MPIPADQRDRARLRLDERFARLPGPDAFLRPAGGWLRAVREALGITLAKAAASAGVRPQSLLDMEKSETAGTASLASVRRAAEAIGCEFVYAVVPKGGSLQALADRIREEEIRADVESVDLTMGLEGQRVSRRRLQDIVRDLGKPKGRR